MCWSYYAASEKGYAHIKNGKPKQDYILTEIFNQCIIFVIADGAGTANYSDVSSNLLCHFFVKKVKQWLKTNELDSLDKCDIEQWIKIFQKILMRINRYYNTDDIRDFASTMILAVVEDSKAVFCQIGDGCIVINSNNNLQCVFWPQNGEYINTTNFVTDKNISQKIMFKILYNNITEISIFTDGLESIALNFSKKEPHVPFFTPFFNLLKNCPPGENKELSDALAEFLNSELICKKTYDDKTIVFGIKGA